MKPVEVKRQSLQPKTKRRWSSAEKARIDSKANRILHQTGRSMADLEVKR